VALVLGLAWAVAVVALVRPRLRPPRVRVALSRAADEVADRIASRSDVDRSGGVAASLRWLGTLSGRVGGWVRRGLHRPGDAVADRRLGRSLLLVLVGAAAGFGVPAVVLAMAWWGRPVLATRRARRREDAELVDTLPDAIDLLCLAVHAGANIRLAVETVAVRAGGPMGRHLGEVCRSVATGARLADALEALRSVEVLRPLAEALLDAERYGVALGPALDRLGTDSRSIRRRGAEERARRLPVAMLLPLIGCVLPSFALLTVVPLFAGSLRSLRL
jgi:Flp pilus assembly protein TadB